MGRYCSVISYSVSPSIPPVFRMCFKRKVRGKALAEGGKAETHAPPDSSPVRCACPMWNGLREMPNDQCHRQSWTLALGGCMFQGF